MPPADDAGSGRDATSFSPIQIAEGTFDARAGPCDRHDEFTLDAEAHTTVRVSVTDPELWVFIRGPGSGDAWGKGWAEHRVERAGTLRVTVGAYDVAESTAYAATVEVDPRSPLAPPPLSITDLRERPRGGGLGSDMREVTLQVKNVGNTSVQQAWVRMYVGQVPVVYNLDNEIRTEQGYPTNETWFPGETRKYVFRYDASSFAGDGFVVGTVRASGSGLSDWRRIDTCWKVCGLGFGV